MDLNIWFIINYVGALDGNAEWCYSGYPGPMYLLKLVIESL